MSVVALPCYPSVKVHGVGGGFTLPLTITAPNPMDVKVYISSLIGYVAAGVYVLNAGPSGWLGGNSTNYTSYSTSPLTVHVANGGVTTLQVTVAMSGSVLTTPADLFTVDSIVYEEPVYVQTGGMYTYCTVDSLDIADRYEFGHNGQMKVNEVAGMANHYTALFWEYDLSGWEL